MSLAPAAQLGHHGAERRVMRRAVLVLAVAGHHLRIGVFIDGTERADDGQLVPHAGLQGEVFADLDAGHVGGDRLELAAKLDGRFRLEVVHVHVRRAAAQVDHDGRLDRGWSCRCRPSPRPAPQHAGQRQTRAEGADLEEAAAVDAVAVALTRSPKCEHLRHPPNWFRNRLPIVREGTKARLRMLPSPSSARKSILTAKMMPARIASLKE